MYVGSLEIKNEVEMSFAVKFNLGLQWFDYRLTWRNLNEDESLNTPSQDITEKIWIPILTFENTKLKLRTPVDRDARFTVKMQGPYTLASDEEVHEAAYYKGSENSVSYHRDFFLDFRCEFKLQYYPFDMQVCNICLKKQYKERNFVRLISTTLVYSGLRQKPEFFITRFEMNVEENNTDSDITVEIHIKRRISQHIFGTYLPSFFILLLGQVNCKK